MAYQALGGPEEVIEADAQADVLDDLVGILGVDIVLYGHGALLGEILWRDLDEIGNLGLDRAGWTSEDNWSGGGRSVVTHE